MPDTERKSPKSDAVTQRLMRLVIARVILATAILSTTWAWQGTYLMLKEEDLATSIVALYGIVMTLSAGYSLLLWLNKRHLAQAKVQVWVDLLLICWLVWQTGGHLSPFTTLFILMTSVASYFFTKNETIFYSVGSTAVFLSLSVAMQWRLLLDSGSERGPAAQTIALTVAGILAVGLLAARLADKRGIGEELKETIESFADMRILHERIVESIGSGLITTDLEGTVYAFNRGAEEISGLPAKSVIGKSVFGLLGESARAPFELCLGSDGAPDFGSGTFETVIGSDDDGDRKVSVACTMVPLIGRGGRPSGAIVSFQDVTGIRAMEENLRRSDRLAAVGRMAAGLAHEIRNPLGSMSAALQFLKEKETTSDADAELLDVALRESERLEQIIANFLAYARPTTPAYSKDGLADTNLNQSLSDCRTLLEHSPEMNPGHELRFEIPAEPIVISASPSQIKQVFWNLARNAIQAMPSGGALHVTLDRAGRNARIVFEDTGKGIDPGYLEHIFEPFSDKASGTGLGLSIVHRIVTDHGGRIDIESELNKGTRVTVEFPQ